MVTDPGPSMETVAMAVAYMFNRREWEYFSGLNSYSNEYVKVRTGYND